jgi:UDP-2,3-diacylglucosamine pyrophosphatase LpxH
MTQKKNIPELLLQCEELNIAPKYIIQHETYKEQRSSLFGTSSPVRTEPVKYNADGEEIFVVSDLHIAAGRNNAGVYKGTENFFADDSFCRFLDYADKIKKTRNALLIINGDIFDFLRITEYPGKVKKVRFSKRLKHALKLDPISKPVVPTQEIIGNQFLEWQSVLEQIGINKSIEELENSISKKEEIYGLYTDDYKSVYKLLRVRTGHPVFFKALGNWFAKGNKLVILKGNHDLELYWRAVRNYLRLILAEEIVTLNEGSNIYDILLKIILPNLTFIDDSMEIENIFYIEHGHRYDKFCMVLDDPILLKYPSQINIPFGSFFNRYLLNRVELFFPFLDNVRPTGNVLPMLMQENFPLGIKVLFQHIPFMIRMLLTNFRYVKFMFQDLFWFFIAFIAPVSAAVLVNLPIIEKMLGFLPSSASDNPVITFLGVQIKNVGFLFLSYLLSRAVAWFQLDEPSSLDSYAKERFHNTDYKIMTMGHTHNPGEYLFDNGQRFYNTGTWIPIIEISTADVRQDKTYTFLHLPRNSEGKLQPPFDGLLQRWNDEAVRADAQVLVEKK